MTREFYIWHGTERRADRASRDFQNRFEASERVLNLVLAGLIVGYASLILGFAALVRIAFF